jgi:hypothetical protein
VITGGLIGKVVKTDNVHFIGFMYPDFPILSYLYSIGRNIPGVIYVGKERLNPLEKSLITKAHSKKDLQEMGIPFISTYSTDEKYDIDLTTRTTIIDLVYSKWGMDYTKILDIDVIRSLLMMDEWDYYDFLKLRWLSKECCSDLENTGLIKIHSLLNSSLNEIYATVLSMKDHTVATMELSLTNFIMTVITQDYYPDWNDERNSMMNVFDRKSIGRDNELAVLFAKYRSMNHDKKIKLLWLITQLKYFLE